MFCINETRLPSLDLMTSTSPGTTLASTPTEYFSSSPDQLSQSSGNVLHDVSSGTAVSMPYSTGGARSPGKFSLTRSRNLKEYDEELDRLNKENVDLKIRIHLMEEKYGAKPQKFEKNGLKRAYYELQLEMDDLKKKLKDKQELVQNASKLLLVLENQYKNELDQVKDNHEKQTSDLLIKIAQLQKESNFDRGDLTQLCDLAFERTEEREITSAFKPVRVTNSSATPEGIFSIPSNELLNSSHPGAEDRAISSDRIKQLEVQIVFLQTKVVDLEHHIADKQRSSYALEEDVSNLKKELEDREDKLSDLELEVIEKDQKVDQLMQNLETRHMEIEAKDTTIQTLHDDLNKVEPEIETKVQQLIERDKIIDEKLEQLQQQNKILVEIQITLDEKQKQIAELESQLRQEQEKYSNANKELMCSCEAMKLFLEKIEVLEKDNGSIRKDLRRKEKKIRDLVAELKEALELVNKVKWEAEMSGCEDGVKEMAEEENERVWAELEQKKRDLTVMKEQMDSAARDAAEKIHKFSSQSEETEIRINKLQILLGENEKEAKNCGNGFSNSELLALKEQIESRNSSLRTQQSLIDNMKGELTNSRAELSDRKEEIKELKIMLFQKSSDVQDFITKELLGRNKEVHDLHEKLSAFSGKDKNIDIFKMFLDVKGYGQDDKVVAVAKDVIPIVQTRSNSLSKLNEEVKKNGENKDDGNAESNSKSGRSNSFSQLENALYAQMGQKVYNTNQTFNTYVMSGEADGKPSNDSRPIVNEKSILPDQALQKDVISNDPFDETKAKALLSNILSKNKIFFQDTGTSKTTDDGECESSFNQYGNNLEPIYNEMKQYKQANKALLKEKQILQQKILSLQKSEPMKSGDSGEETNSFLQKQLQESRENTIMKDQMVSNFRDQIESLKEELKGTTQNIASKVLEVSSAKYEESLQKYKQEIISLRKRLADSHDACNLLRDRLEELTDFLEQILEMERRGKLSLNHLSVSRRISLQKTLDDSRSLSHSLSQSLMIGTESILEDSEASLASPFEVPLSEITEQIDLGHLNLSMVANVLKEDQLASAVDIPSDCHKDLIRALLVSEMDAKTEEIEAIFLKLNQLGNVVQVKDDHIKEQTESIISLTSEVETLQRDLHLTEQLLLQYRAVISGGNSLSGNPQSVNCLAGPISSVVFNESNSSLHLSALQHSILNPAPDVAENIIFQPDSDHCSSCSTALPPPPVTFFSSQEDSLRDNPQLESSEVASANTCTPQNVNNSSQSFVKPESREGMILERLENAAPPVLNLASPSESEAWSEPDRNVSLARIGLDVSTLVAANHDRSRSRATKSAPFTSESDGENRPEEYRDGTPCNKTKRRSDAAEIKRLLSKLRSIEQMNDTLRAELHIYQTLSQHFSDKKSMDSCQSDVVDSESSVTIPSSLFQEIRCLRRKLEEAITNNDLLRDQLEAALSGYLNEETRSLTGKLSAAQQELKLNQEQMISTAAIEQNLRIQLKETDAQVYELNERLTHYLASTEQMDKKIQYLSKDLKVARENAILMETTLTELQLQLKYRDKNITAQELKIQLLETECSTLKVNLETSFESKKDKELKIQEQNIYILKIEEKTFKYENCLKNLQQESKHHHKERIELLEKDLQDSEQKRLKVSKENLSLVKVITKLQSKLESFKTQSDLLKLEVRELSASEDSGSEKELESLNRKLRSSHFSLQGLQVQNEAIKVENESFKVKLEAIRRECEIMKVEYKTMKIENELIKVEKAALQKEMQLLQEEAAALRSHLDHVLARDTKISCKESKEIVSLQQSYDHLQLEHASLQDSFSSFKGHQNSILDNEWVTLKEQIESYKNNEADLERVNCKHRELDSKNQELISQLDSERCLTKNLQLQNNSLQTKMKSLRENSNHGSAYSRSLSNVEGIHLKPRISELCPKRVKDVPSSQTWMDNKENQFPSRQSFSLSQFDDDATSGDSPDLGIGSDGQFSSMEKLNTGFNVVHQLTSSERISQLCSDSSHGRLISENESIRQDCDSLRKKLRTTKVTLQEALDQLSKANSRKESIERAIYRQLTKTHDVLKQASGNLRHQQKDNSHSS